MENQIGGGEHVIPRNIYGFWRIKDICKDCMKYFGDYVDGLGAKNTEIINAMNFLELPNASRYLDELPYEGEDTATGEIKKMIRKGSHFRVKVHNIDNSFFECDEETFHTLGINWIKKVVPNEINAQKGEKEIERLKDEYDRIAPGSEIKSELFGIVIKKAQIHDIKIVTRNIGTITPLIAKIALCYLYYCLSGEQLKSIVELPGITNHARNNKSIKPFLINRCKRYGDNKYLPIHLLSLELCPYSLLLDVALFRQVNYRIVLQYNGKPLIMGKPPVDCDRIDLLLDFSNLEDRKMAIGWRKIGERQVEYYQLFS